MDTKNRRCCLSNSLCRQNAKLTGRFANTAAKNSSHSHPSRLTVLTAVPRSHSRTKSVTKGSNQQASRLESSNGVDVKKIGGDASYAGNANSEMCTSNGIQTSFVQNGKRAKEKRGKDFVRQELARVRATAIGETGVYWDSMKVLNLSRNRHFCTESHN